MSNNERDCLSYEVDNIRSMMDESAEFISQITEVACNNEIRSLENVNVIKAVCRRFDKKLKVVSQRLNRIERQLRS